MVGARSQRIIEITSKMKNETAAITGGRFNIDHRVEEKHPSLAGLAATYSSKP